MFQIEDVHLNEVYILYHITNLYTVSHLFSEDSSSLI